MHIEIKNNTLFISLEGRLDCDSIGELWSKTIAILNQQKVEKIEVSATKVSYCDSAGAIFLVELEKYCDNVEITGLAEEYTSLVTLFKQQQLASAEPTASGSLIVEIGQATYDFFVDLKQQVTFVGELLVAMFWSMRHSRLVPWKDIFIVAEGAGVNALPIVCLIGFLLGLVMAFQSAIPMQQVGAEIFVADLVGISMLKELGPLMTAIILAGRSGSAFAAELGTMKVNEEINALVTMGLDPVRFLSVTRVIASVLMMPFLTIFCSFSALAGGAIVLLSLGYPLITYIDRVIFAVSLSAFIAGMLKSLVFAVLVAGVGCLRGLQTGTGAKAVGDSTTSAVVSGIILVAIADAIFAVILYALGI